MADETNVEETETVSDRPNVEGIVVQNTEVQGYIRKNGAPVHSKPHGAEKTVLYYPKPAGKAENGEKFKDHAGERTPGTRDRIVQKPLMGSTEIGSTVARRTISGGGAPPLVSPSALGNPNTSLADAEIVNSGDLDEEVTNLEKETLEKREETRATTLSTGEKVAKISQDPVSDAPAPSIKEEKEKASEDKPPAPGDEEPAPGQPGDQDEPYFKADEPAS